MGVINERCCAYEDERQCRRTKNLTRTRITVHREKTFLDKLPEGAVILLCPKHLRLSVLERAILTKI